MYQVALFIHILGVFGIVAGHTLIHVGLEVMRRAQTIERIRDWAAILAGLDKFMPPVTLAVLVAGVYMAWTRWGWTTPWIDASLVIFLLLMILGPLLPGRRFAAINRAVKTQESGIIPDTLVAQYRDRTLWIIENASSALILAMLFLMTTKPGLAGTLVVIVTGLALGIVIGALSPTDMPGVVPPVAQPSASSK